MSSSNSHMIGQHDVDPNGEWGCRYCLRVHRARVIHRHPPVNADESWKRSSAMAPADQLQHLGFVIEDEWFNHWHTPHLTPVAEPEKSE